MAFAEIENLLKQRMGLDAASIGPSAIARAVQERQASRRLENADAYWDCVRDSEVELQELIEAVIVPETWFFRDREVFVALARVVEAVRRLRDSGRVLRLLSLPCSTGEEPYSMAMALLADGVPDDGFRIDAVDISALAIDKARRGFYGRNSFRGNDLRFRDRFFDATEQGYRLQDRVKATVDFQRGNLFAPGFLPGAGRYHIVFCRNLLIYFDRPTQDRALAVLGQLLAPEGILFVGPAETGLLLQHGFASARLPLAFAFRKAPSAPEPAPTSGTALREARRRARAPVPMPPFPRRPPALPPIAAPPGRPRPAATALPAPSLDDAFRLADQGRLGEALRLCEAHVRLQGPSARSFQLMGLVHDATDHPRQAADCYRRALYLEPNHPEILAHLAVLLETQGDADGARRLHERLRRVQGRRGG